MPPGDSVPPPGRLFTEGLMWPHFSLMAHPLSLSKGHSPPGLCCVDLNLIWKFCNQGDVVM